MKSPIPILKRWSRWLVPWRNSIYGCSPSIPDHLEMDSFRFINHIYRYICRVRHKCKQKLQLKFSTLRSARFIQLFYLLIPFWWFFLCNFTYFQSVQLSYQENFIYFCQVIMFFLGIMSASFSYWPKGTMHTAVLWSDFRISPHLLAHCFLLERDRKQYT